MGIGGNCYGGAIYLQGGKIKADFTGASSTVKFINNQVQPASGGARGGALAIGHACDCTNITVTFACKAVEFKDNYAKYDGGAIYMSSSGTATINFQAPSSFTHNEAGGFASAIELHRDQAGVAYDPGTIIFDATACFTRNHVENTPTNPQEDHVLWVTGGRVQVAATAALNFRNNRGSTQAWPEVDVYIAAPGQVLCGSTAKPDGSYSVEGDFCSSSTCSAAASTNCSCAVAGAIPDPNSCGCTALCTTNPAIVVPNANPWPNSCAPSLAGAKCSSSCLAGFQGSPAAVCTFSGQWAPLGGCTPTPCIGLPPITPPFSTWTNTLCALPGYRTESNSSCTASCLPGYSGAPAVVCSGGDWLAAPLAGTPCTPNPCPSKPSQTPQHASWPAAGCNTTAGAVCQATCDPGYAGQPYANCSAGAWSAIQGSACVSCGASLTAPLPPPAAVCEGSSSLTATFSLTSTGVSATTFTATVDGAVCSPPPSSLQQA